MTNQYTGEAVWTPERVALFERLVGDGMTFEKAGAEVGVSKNAAIRKAHRMGFGRRADAVLNPTQKAHPTKVQIPPAFDQRLAKIGPFPPAGHCVFPLWKDARPDYRFCGEKVEGDGPYCDACHQLTHVKGSAGSADD